jgi:DNA-directed RNA polymerase subunit RPC12/RpoP
MIQIDDAGSGSLVGGTCIASLRVETGEYYYDIIPVNYYTKRYFDKKLYLDKTCQIVKEHLIKLRIKRGELIEVCQGYMFDKARRWLDNNTYNYVSKKIQDPLQSKIENTFGSYIISLGLPYGYLKYTKYPFHFHKLLRWVYADYQQRSKLCKSGWKSWEKYGNLPLTVITGVAPFSHYVCLKCGKRIYKDQEIRIIKYTSNCSNTIFLHRQC